MRCLLRSPPLICLRRFISAKPGSRLNARWVAPAQILSCGHALCCNPALALLDSRRDDWGWRLCIVSIAAGAGEQAAPENSPGMRVAG